MQLSIFDAKPFQGAALSGEDRKKQGIETVSQNNQDWLGWIREKARRIARNVGSVSADDLRNVAVSHHWEPIHPNAWGAVFRGAEWQIIGRKKSTTPSAHSRTINIYRLRGNNENKRR